jgi:RNA polymerase sigma factor (sigma-70 family)
MRENFEDLVGKLSPTLRRITHKLNGHFSFFDEDDLFQEALEHLWRAFNDGKLTAKTESYVLQGCYFHLKNYLRKTLDKTRALSLEQLMSEEDGWIERSLGKEDPAIEEALDTSDISEAAKKCNLSERELKVMKLGMDGRTTREIGDKLGVSHVMVVKIIKNIRKKFRTSKYFTGTGYQN